MHPLFVHCGGFAPGHQSKIWLENLSQKSVCSDMRTKKQEICVKISNSAVQKTVLCSVQKSTLK